MSVIARLVCQDKTLRLRKGKYSDSWLVPVITRGPFGCWLASWRWGQIGWELNRWS